MNDREPEINDQSNFGFDANKSSPLLSVIITNQPTG